MYPFFSLLSPSTPFSQILTIMSISKGVGFIRFDKKRIEAEEAIKRLNGQKPPGATEPITGICYNPSQKTNQAILSSCTSLQQKVSGPLAQQAQRFR